jgi:hypothetical protein
MTLVFRQVSDCEMSKKFSSFILAFASLLVLSGIAHAQNAKPVVFATLPKATVARLSFGEAESIDVPGRATLTVTAANFDDTITGIIVYTIADEARQKISKALGIDLSGIPTSYLKKDVVAGFPDGTACPIMHLTVPALEVAGAGIKMQLDRTLLEINEQQGQMAQLICSWTRQINAKRQRRGIIAAINRLIVGDQ